MEQKDHSSKDLSHLNVQGKVFVYFLVHATGISGASEETCKDEAKFINYFVLVALLPVKVTKNSNNTREIFHEYDILDIDTDQV